MMRWLQALIVLAVSGSAWPQSMEQVSGTFKITQTNPVVSTSTISGKETYTISSTPDGFNVTSTLWVAEGEIPVLSQVFNGVLLPFVLVFMLLLVNKSHLMGKHVNTRFFNWVAWGTAAVMIVLSVVLIFQ